MSRHRRQQRRRAGRVLRYHRRMAAQVTTIPNAADRAMLDNIQPLSTESLNSPLMQMLPRESPALATADALFGALGFRRVE